MESVILRVDGSKQIGIGHIMRCIALAEGFSEVGLKSVFVVKGGEQRIVELIRTNGYISETISQNGTSLEDVSATLCFADKYCSKIIVTDISNVSTMSDIQEYLGYLQAIKKGGKYLITIDGFGGDCISDKVSISSDMIIVPYFNAEGRKYKKNGAQKLLLGPAFFIFRQEFLDIIKLPKEIAKDVSNILVSMGGADPSKCTIRVVKALTLLQRPYLNIKVVVGISFTGELQKEVKAISENARCNFEIIFHSPDMAKLLYWADLAILSSGLTMYEAAATRTPALVLSQYPYHEKIMNGFSKAGSFQHLGYGPQVSEKAIAKAVEQLSDDFALRKEMVRNGRELVDGEGVNRVISSIPKELMV